MSIATATSHGQTSRRRFLLQASAASVLGLPACIASPRYRGPVSGGARVAVVGLRTQGRRHLQFLLQCSDVDVTAICDPDPQLLGYAMAMAGRLERAAVPYRDVRRMLASAEIDAVVIATPDHWHCLIATWAIAAGKHVYIEAPVVHGIEEAESLLLAAGRSDRLVRVAMPLRVHPGIRHGVEYLHRGGLGQIHGLRAFSELRRRSIGLSEGPCSLPPGLDFDLWAGPAALELPQRLVLHGDWRFDWRTGNGDCGEWGVHVLDLARWVGELTEYPEGLWVGGGRCGPWDDGETPNTLVAGLRHRQCRLVFELCSLVGAGAVPVARRRWQPDAGIPLGVVVAGSKGQMVFDARRGVSRATGHQGELLAEFAGRGDPLAQFVTDLNARRRRTGELRAVLRSTVTMHLIHMALRNGTEFRRSDGLRDLADERSILDGLQRIDGSLARRGLEFDELGLLCSGWRTVDRDSAMFLDSSLGNEMRASKYRSPFAMNPRLRSV